MGKFDGATPGELADYAAESVQRSNETDTAWAQRVQMAEAALLAKVAARQAVDTSAPPAGY